MSYNNWLKTGFDDSLAESKTWDNLWRQHFREYQRDLRHAYFIRAIRRPHESRCLEIAAGSFRDTIALNRWGYYSEGIDFSRESVMKAQELYPLYNDRFKSMDAGALKYSDKAFDVTFHNGFWGFFDDQQIIKLGLEQRRVTKSRMIATVHNAHNQSFRQKFIEWGEKDPLYRVRFFTVSEITALMRQFYRRVTVLPVGGGRLDAFINRRRNPLLIRYLFWMRLYRRERRIQTSERLMCIGEIV